MEKTSKKLRYSKASFLHYCKNPYVYAERYGGKDTLLTMELVSAPSGCMYKRIVDKKMQKELEKEAAREEREKRKKEMTDALIAEKMAEIKAERRREKRIAAGEEVGDEDEEKFAINDDA